MEHVFDGVAPDFALKSSTSRSLKANALRLCAALFLLVLSTFGNAPEAQSGKVLVFAAASLKTALDEINAQWQGRTGKRAVVSYAASSALAKQLESGAPADMFISADLDWMDYAQQRQLIRPETRTDLLGNRLVLVAPATSDLTVAIEPNFPLATLLQDGRLAMADPDSVPAGKYGKAALEKLGVWSSVEGKVARAENVRAALFFVSRQEAPLGIVYQTDAAADKGVKIVAAFPEDTHPPIVYPVALSAASKNPGAVKFLGFLESPAARPIFEKHGFTVLR